MRRRKAVLEQQPHRVALVAEGRLHARRRHCRTARRARRDRAVGLLPARAPGPIALDLGEPALAAHMIVGRDARRTLASVP